MGVGLRFRNPDTPAGYKIEVLIDGETLPKMLKLLKVTGGQILFQQKEETYIRLIVEKRPERSDSLR